MLTLRFVSYCMAVFLSFGVLFASEQAQADQDAIGAACSNIGMTEMTSDKQNIMACLKNTTGDLVWKTMTISGISVRTVAGSLGNIDGDSSVAYCNDDEIVLSGGGLCSSATAAAALLNSGPVTRGETIWAADSVKPNAPTIIASHNGWLADCTSPNNVIAPALAYVVCAK